MRHSASFRFLWILLPLVCCLPKATWAEEGMFPMTELERLDLASKGFQLGPRDLFHPGGIGLVQGICRVNGCTGSFVSPGGLIITNHHCAFEAIQNASNKQQDYLEQGFVAATRQQEIPAPGYTVRITERFTDVSESVLAAATPDMGFADRTKAIDRRRKELEQAAEKANPGLRAEVAEMFTGKSYYLFLYTYLKDIRLVFAPPASIGAFGGETDNWEWPRHTGDFSLMRAYTAPDGSSAPFAKENVPYRPKRVVRVEPKGVAEEDLVFLLGYPGRTVRHRTASFLQYEQAVRLPTIVSLYSWQIAEMEAAGKADREVAIRHASRMKSLANVEKRSRGQLLGMQRKGILEAKRKEEMQLREFIDADPQRRARYGQLLDQLDRVYQEMTEAAPLELHLKELRSACRALSFAFTIVDAAHERSKGDLEREAPYMDRNWDQTRQQLLLDAQDWHPATDQKLLAGMLERLAGIPAAHQIQAIADKLPDDQGFAKTANSLFASSQLGVPAQIEPLLEMNPQQLAETSDPLLKWMIELYPHYLKLRERDKEVEGKLAQAYGELIDVKRQFLDSRFIPDANATLRLTFGHVRGYSPSDAIYKSPITTLNGLLEKTTGVEPFITPNQVLVAHEKGQFAGLVDPASGQVPVAILYDTDTTGGNSGSPVFNARGELVGVNFDRTFEATINDFAWNPDYSRSIAVDIRFVLWVTGVAYPGQHIVREMGVELP
jgi:hypothetical protein